MNKGQSDDNQIKNILKFFKMNEDRFSTLLGIVVVFLVAGMMVNYFKHANLNIWKGSLLSESEPKTTSVDQLNNEISKDDSYKVVKGDTLWRISERYYGSGYNYVDVIKENKLDKNGKIEVGQVIKFPKVEAKTKTTKLEVTAQEKKMDTNLKNGSGTIDAQSYTTVKGDTLWSIAVRSYGDGFKWTKIYWENRGVIGKNPNILFSGLKLQLPKI